jgi:Cd2+/Zn2+-exporting ATPase
MEKIKIDLDIVLPDVPDERDKCVQRIISATESKKGIEKVHIVPETETSKAKLCFHYDPEEISIELVQDIAERAGAEITERFGHLLLEVKGIRHVRILRWLLFSMHCDYWRIINRQPVEVKFKTVIKKFF